MSDTATDDGTTEDLGHVGNETSIDDSFPSRPHNHSTTLPFHELFTTLFNPLNENKKKPAGLIRQAKKRQGPHGPKILTPSENRRDIVERFVSRWRKEVGNDIYPAFRLIVPDKDRERPMYGLKEKTIGKLLVRLMRIDKNSEDGYNLLNWKLPGIKSASVNAGDFAGRCFEVLQKRPIRTTVGNLTINEVNEMLDRLSAAPKEDGQLIILEDFYKQMNPEELMWLIRIILRYMKIGATERTIFEVWHPDAENLFNVSSSLRRVCWELSNPTARLQDDDKGVKLMQCFQPQLAAFQMKSIERIVSLMRPTETDDEFWIEEKLDGERMQLHMQADPNVAGGMRFNYWSRKAKDYTYLYGNGYEEQTAALTRHIKPAFHAGVCNIILDGEMITWDPEQDAIVPFGTLKTAALAEQRNPFATGHRPFFKVFDCLFLNGKDLTRYTLRDRRKALNSAVSSVHRRIEVHDYTSGRTVNDIEKMLRQVVEESSEGLVLKNPRSMYKLNERNDDWMKVKPEYMAEFGEALDCIVIGGYYGTGKRGGRLSSFLCGLRVDDVQIKQGADRMKCYSFFKVGGGFAASDYADVRHRTEGKWHDWDAKNPPKDLIELGGGSRQFERPDCWIRPDDSVVLEVKAASVTGTDQFRVHYTLRFPRFRKIRTDKDWTSALSINEFMLLKDRAEAEKHDKQFKVDDARKKRSKKPIKKQAVVAGYENVEVALEDKTTTVLFTGRSFYVMTECLDPKKTKAELEQLIKSNGGSIVQQERDDKTFIIADRNLVKVASMKKAGKRTMIRPSWILDCLKQAQIDAGRPDLMLPYEPKHVYFCPDEHRAVVDASLDEYGDSYTLDVDSASLKRLMSKMSDVSGGISPDTVMRAIDESHAPLVLTGSLFTKCTVYIAHEASSNNSPSRVRDILEFCGCRIVDSLGEKITHVVAENEEIAEQTRVNLGARKGRLPRIVSREWVVESFRERTLLDEERFMI